MKYTETFQENGETVTREVQIPLNAGRSQVCYNFVPADTDEPINVKIVQAGWYDGGPTFHVLTEYGDYMHTDYEYLTLAQLYNKHPEFKPVFESDYHDVIFTSREILQTNISDLVTIARERLKK
jgi:hypothetical protein